MSVTYHIGNIGYQVIHFARSALAQRYNISDSQSREPEFESHLLLFRGLEINVFSTMPQFTQLYKWVPGISHGSD